MRKSIRRALRGARSGAKAESFQRILNTNIATTKLAIKSFYKSHPKRIYSIFPFCAEEVGLPRGLVLFMPDENAELKDVQHIVCKRDPDNKVIALPIAFSFVPQLGCDAAIVAMLKSRKIDPNTLKLEDAANV